MDCQNWSGLENSSQGNHICVRHFYRGERMNYEEYMKLVISLSDKASNNGEIPVAAIIVKDEKIIAKAYNCKEAKNDSTKHAEIIAIQKASKKLNNWRLNKCLLFVNLEPCLMCMGAIVESRIKRVICGTKNDKYHSLILKIAEDNNIKIEYNVLEKECSDKLKRFFYNKR